MTTPTVQDDRLERPARVLIWNENRAEHQLPGVNAIYPGGIHAAIASALARSPRSPEIATATLDEPEHGLTAEALARTDVLVWWAHLAHDDVDDAVAERVATSVRHGMGLIVLHSAHLSKPFRLLMGTSCNLRWRESDDKEVVWTVHATHPIADGVRPAFVIPQHETYSEYFDIPAPDELVFVSSFSGGEVFRSGCCFNRGAGRVFYFSPGHETFPVYHSEPVQRVIANAVEWARPRSEEREVYETEHAPEGWFEPRPEAEVA